MIWLTSFFRTPKLECNSLTIHVSKRLGHSHYQCKQDMLALMSATGASVHCKIDENLSFIAYPETGEIKEYLNDKQ